MTINARCECGWHEVVSDDLLGKEILCEECGAMVLVKRRKKARKRKPAAIEEELEELIDSTQSAASNPAMLRVSYFRYVMAYPKWPVIFSVFLAGSIALSATVSWWFGILVAFFAWALHMHRQRVKSSFIAGCVNPAQVLSLTPPLVGVFTDLRKGPGEWPVIKVMPQPLHKTTSGLPVEGQRLPTVASYQSMFDELEHWDDFHPRLPDVASSDAEGLDRILASIPEDEWQEMEAGLAQIPKSPKPGLYRIYSRRALTADRKTDRRVVAKIVSAYLDGLSSDYCFTPDDGLTLEKVSECRSGYAKSVKQPEMLAIVEGKGSDASTGMLLTPDGFHFHFRKFGKGRHKWSEVIGAFCDEQTFEVYLTDDRRLRIPRNQFMSGVLARLESTINEIAESTIQ